jgi:thiamine biosynthesis lipoprotein
MTTAATWSLWSTTARLVVLEDAALPAARALVDHYLAEVDDAANRFRDDSEIRRLVPPDHGDVTVSPVLADLLRAALDVADLTDGDVDPTVGDALRRLGYDRDLRLVVREGAPVRAVVRPAPGHRKVRLVRRELRLPAGVELDLGATAKAVAADRAAALVHDRLGVGVLESLGGDIATAGPAPDQGWQVKVQDTDDVPAYLSIPAGSAVATSSTRSRRWRRGDEDVHHVVDPRTGRPAPTYWRSVTVVASTCLAANAATTASIVRGEAAHAWLTGLGATARLVRHDGVVVTTGSWPKEVAA